MTLSAESLLASVHEEIPGHAITTIGTYLVAAENLGQRTAELHLALAQETSQPAFRPEPMRLSTLRQLSKDLCEHAQQVLQSLWHRLPGLCRPPCKARPNTCSTTSASSSNACRR